MASRACVTGGGGFIASWLVKLLLSRGYTVHATLRDPCAASYLIYSLPSLATLHAMITWTALTNQFSSLCSLSGHPKNAHLKQLEGAPENLHLFRVDVLDCETLAPALQGCQGVFHLATPVPEDKILHPDREVLDPAVKGTLNVLKVCSTLKVHKVVVMSSIAAVTSNPNWPQDRLKDESCWSDKEFCKENEDWYSLAKTLAEQEAFEYARNNGLKEVLM